jgi:hypothetical protein
MQHTLYEPPSQWLDHNSHIMVPIAYLASLFPEQAMGLVAIQAAFMATSVLAFYWVARRIGIERMYALGATLIYAQYPYFSHLVLFDFHPIALAPLGILLGILGIGFPTTFMIAVIFLSAIKETGAMMAIGLCVYAWKRSEMKLYLAFIVIPIMSLGWFGFWLWWNDAGYVHTGNAGMPWDHFGPKAISVLWILLPVGFVVSGGWIWAIALPEIALAVLSGNIYHQLIFHQYHASIATVVLISMLHAIKEKPFRLFFAAAGMIFGVILFSPMGLVFHNNCITPGVDFGLHERLDAIPRNLSVCAENHLMPHVADRMELRFADVGEQCDVWLVDEDSGWYKAGINEPMHDDVVQYAQDNFILLWNHSTVKAYGKRL